MGLRSGSDTETEAALIFKGGRNQLWGVFNFRFSLLFSMFEASKDVEVCRTQKYLQMVLLDIKKGRIVTVYKLMVKGFEVLCVALPQSKCRWNIQCKKWVLFVRI